MRDQRGGFLLKMESRVKPHTLTLSAGQYTLTGTKEEILLIVP